MLQLRSCLVIYTHSEHTLSTSSKTKAMLIEKYNSSPATTPLHIFILRDTLVLHCQQKGSMEGQSV